MVENTRYPAYMSHFPVLAAVVANSTGPVLELGCGDGSTPMLHEMCRPTKRPLLTVEHDAGWLNKFHARLATPWHRFELISSLGWASRLFQAEADWGVVFVDHGNGNQRVDSLLQFSGVPYPVWVVVHDAGPGGINHYHLGPGVQAYRYCWAWSDYWPHTIVLSNHRAWADAE